MSGTLHASVVAWRGRGLLILGASGAGKSSAALRLIDAGWMLVADDQVVIRLDPSPLGKGNHDEVVVDGADGGVGPFRQPSGLPPPPKGEDRGALMFASAPPTLAGLLEIRGLGIQRLPYRLRAPLVAAISLDPPRARLPDGQDRFTWGPLSLPLSRVDPHAPDLPARCWALLATV
jgi:HPr kinase/phosphorylase